MSRRSGRTRRRSMQPRSVVAALLCFGTALAIGLARPWASANGTEPPTDPPGPDVPQFVDGSLRLSETYAQRIGLTTEPAVVRTIAPTTEVTGELDFSPEHVAAVSARIFGHVREVLVVPGQEVESGDPLAQLESSALGRAQAELLSARARERLAEKDRERKHLLTSEGIAAHRSLEVAHSELEAARARRRAAQQTVRAMGGRSADEGSLGRFVLRAPIDGEVTKVNVYKGQAVQPDHVAFKVADLTRLWLELAVFEHDLSNVDEGDEVMVRPHGDEDTVVSGRVEHVGSIIDPGSRTADVRVRVDNADRVLRVGQAVRASIISRGAEVRALSVPRRSVVLVDGEPTVFVAPSDDEVAPRAVTLGVRGREYVEVRDGLVPGERVVVDGVFELKSELFR